MWSAAPLVPGVDSASPRPGLRRVFAPRCAMWRRRLGPFIADIGAGAIQPVTVTVAAPEPEPGVYTAEIIVVTNDPLSPRLAVPVTVTVTG